MLYFDYFIDVGEKKNSLKWVDLVCIYVGWNMMWCIMIIYLFILDFIVSLGGDKIVFFFNKCNINKFIFFYVSCFVFLMSMFFRLLFIILIFIDVNYFILC